MTSWKPAILEMAPFGPEYDRDFIVESRSGGGRYTVNLHRYTCTCPDFAERRAVRTVGDLGRSCKHLRDAVLSLDRDAFGDELTRVIFKSPHGPYDMIWFAPDARREIVAAAMVLDGPWMNIFARKGGEGPYVRYGFHIADERWAYGTAPENAAEILAMLKTLPSHVT